MYQNCTGHEREPNDDVVNGLSCKMKEPIAGLDGFAKRPD